MPCLWVSSELAKGELRVVRLEVASVTRSGGDGHYWEGNCSLMKKGWKGEGTHTRTVRVVPRDSKAAWVTGLTCCDSVASSSNLGFFTPLVYRHPCELDVEFRVSWVLGILLLLMGLEAYIEPSLIPRAAKFNPHIGHWTWVRINRQDYLWWCLS